MAALNYILTLLAIVGTGLIAGAFFIFAVAIMSALKRLPANDGMAAMQSINVVIQNPIFLGVFIGTALVSLGLAVMSIMNWNTPISYYILAGAALYIIGNFLLTMVFNVPLNNALDAADPATVAGQEVWQNYLSNWTFWNHVRTIASIAANCLFVFSIAGAK
ncbi:MAG: anthrone oxygenase family protein [Pyrinomonadaceae bacterium]